ncbi:MAG: DUF2975 domain-containing protein [Bacteroidota bacterium]
MKPLSENFFVKTSYAYFNLLKKLYFVVLVFIVGNALSGIGGQNPPWGVHPGVDFFNLFSNLPEFFRPNRVPIALSLYIVFSNILVFALTYMIIRKLDQFLKNIYEDNPFISKNGENLKTVGTVTMVLGMFLSLKDVFLKINLLWASDWTKTLLVVLHMFGFLVNTYFIIGLFAYALGEIMIRGSKLKEEIDLTV